jgi:hypothetical protein
MAWHKLEFVDRKVEGGIRRGWWGTRHGALLLVPESIPELEDVVTHQDLQAMDDGDVWDASAARRGSEESGNHRKRVICVNVSVH